MRRAKPLTCLNLESENGEVAERFKAAVLKTVVPSGTGGSNPSLSANFLTRQTKGPRPFIIFFMCFVDRSFFSAGVLRTLAR